jgi:hypothetical protein
MAAFAGGSIVDIPLVSVSGVTGTGDAVPDSGRPAADNDDANHPVAGKGAAGHGGDTDPNRGSFM